MKYHILSIGVSKHQNPDANLQYASKDATDFFTLFTQNISNLGYSKLLSDSEATLSQIRTALGTDLQSQISTEDCFVLFYSGHGAVAPDPNEPTSYSHFLVPFDVTQDIPNSCIPVDYIRDTFKKLHCKSKLFFVDSCFSGAVNSKSYGPSYKSISKIKTIASEISGEGSVVFTASKVEEKSIEDSKLENGVFTSFLLTELQRKIEGIKFSITDLVTPIIENVIEYTNTQHHFKQTPTFTGELKGLLYLPTFKKPLTVRPDLIDIPKSQSVVNTIPISPKIDVSTEREFQTIEDITSFVLRTSNNTIQSKLEFEKFALTIGQNLLDEWERIYINEENTIQNISNCIGQLEGNAYQFFILTSIIGIYGNDQQIKVIGEVCAQLLKATRGKSGLIAFINIPHIVILLTEYLLSITAIVSADFSKFGSFMNTRVYGMEYGKEPPKIVASYNVHYSEALTGYADNVADYVRQSLLKMNWLKNIHPRIANQDITSLQAQANFIIVTFTVHNGFRAWPDFAHLYAEKISPLVEHILYDTDFSKSLAFLFGVPVNELRPKLKNHLQYLMTAGLGPRYWWHSIHPNDILTKEEALTT